MINICVSVPATTTEATIRMIRSLFKPDLIELRLDYALELLDFQRLRESTVAPLIATARVKSHGGLWRGGEDERLRLLISAVKADFDYIDVEADSCFLRELVGEAHAADALVIVSRHYLDRVPDLEEILVAYRESRGADIVKVVGTAQSHVDNLLCLESLVRVPGNVCFAMGALGVPSRVLSPLMGGAFTYASPSEGVTVAPGQLTLSSMREVYRLMGVAL